MDGTSDIMDECFLIVIFVAIGLIGGNLPGGGIRADIKLGEFVFDADLLEFGLRGDFVAESDSVIKHSESDGEDAVRFFGFSKVKS